MTNYKQYTKEALINRIIELEQKAELNFELRDKIQIKNELIEEKSMLLLERVKELNCLFSISDIISDETSMSKMLSRVVNVLPPAWHFPDLAVSRIVFDGKTFKSDGFKASEWKQSSEILIKGKVRGNIDVFYLEKQAELLEEPFLEEERKLIDTISIYLGKAIERIENEKILNDSNRELIIKEQNLIAANQQLSATEQQLKAMNQQLEAANQQLRASEDQNRNHIGQFKSLFDGIEDVIYVSDPNTFELVHVNDTGKKIWGHNIEGEKCYKVLQNRDEPCPFCTNHIIFNETPNEVYVWEFQNNVNNKWFRCADKMIEWPDGRKLRFEIASDITEFKKIGDALIENEKMLRVITENAGEMIFQMALPDRKLIFVSPHSKRIFDYTPNEFIENDKLMQASVHPDWDNYIKDKWEHLFNEGNLADFEYQIITKHGDVKWIHQSNAIVNNEKGEPNSLIGLISDITDRKVIEQKTLRLNEELKIKTEELQQILYITTHDLRSPLVNIQGFSKELALSLNELKELLNQIEIPDNLRAEISEILSTDLPESFHYITSSISKMDALLKGLLQISRLGRKKVIRNNLDTSQLVEDVVRGLQFEIKSSKIHLNIDKLHNCVGDYDQLHQLFSNLLGNAIKFIDINKSPEIKVTSCKTGKYIKYSIEDNGIGISKAHQDKIFQMFEKLNPEKPGLGLGMSIVKQIVEKHRGKIELESIEGVGSTFHIYLEAK